MMVAVNAFSAMDGAMYRILLALLFACCLNSFVLAQVVIDEFNAESFAACSAGEGETLFKPISQIRTVLRHDGDRLPPDCTSDFFAEEVVGTGSRFSSEIDFHWLPTNFFHMPAYLDDVPLERYGQSQLPILQPIISGSKFILQIPILPYKMGVDPVHSCVSTYGHRPPGDCVPCIRQTMPREVDAALVQAAATVGLVFLLP